MQKSWFCPKCQNLTFTEDKITTTSGNLSRFLNVQNKRFLTITCDKCTYTEFYKTEVQGGEKVIDFFGN